MLQGHLPLLLGFLEFDLYWIQKIEGKGRFSVLNFKKWATTTQLAILEKFQDDQKNKKKKRAKEKKVKKLE